MKLARCLLAVLAIASTSAAGAAEFAVSATFSPQEIQVITRYYHAVVQPAPQLGQGHGRGHGASGLPRGIAKNLARGKTMPPGIAKRLLPVALAERLPPPPDGYERVVVAGKILLVEIATQVVHDVLTDVLFR
jgi:Ni/Co efflux regulator RcnB